jgi:hypothetical protein
LRLCEWQAWITKDVWYFWENWMGTWGLGREVIKA